MKRIAHATPAHIVGSLMLLILSTAATAQTPEPPFEGVVTGDDVNIRSGPLMGAYAVTQVNTGQKVSVIDQRPGWLGIKPVAGCYSVVNADYVTPDPQRENKIGTVTGRNVLVFAAGRKQLANGGFSAPQTKLNAGDRVRIIGRVYNADRTAVTWYVIKPPARTRFWVAARFVEPAREEPEETSPPTLTAVDRTETAPPAETPGPLSPIATEPGPSLREEVQLRRQLQAVETLLNEELKKPVQERSLDELLAQTQAISVPNDSRFKAQHDILLKYIQSEQTQIEKYRQARQLVDTVLADSTPEPQPQPAPAAKTWDLSGTLQLSELPPTTNTRTFVVRTPGSDVIRGFATSSNDVDLTAYIGRDVALRGTVAYNRTIAHDVLRATEIKLLDGESSLATTRIPTPTAPVAETPIAPVGPGPLPTIDDPDVADLLEPIALPAEPVVAEQTPEPTPLENDAPTMEPVQPVDERDDTKIAMGEEQDLMPESDDAGTDIPAPTAPEPTRPTMAVAPAQPDIAGPVTPEPGIDTQPIVEPEPVVRPEPADAGPIATTPEPIAPAPVDTTPEPVAVTPEPIVPEPIAPEPVDTTPEPVAVTPEPITPEPIAPEPVDTTPEPVAVTPEPIAPEPVDTTPEPVAVTPEPIMPEPIAPEPVDTTPEPVAVTPEPIAPEPVDTTPEPVAVTPEPIATEPIATEPVDTEPLVMDPDADDVTVNDLGPIRPVSVDPVDLSDSSLEVAVGPGERATTPGPSDVDAGPAASQAPAVVPPPRHSTAMPKEVLVSPEGYEVEFD